MRTPALNSDSHDDKRMEGSKKAPSKGPFQKGLDVLRNISAVRAFVALAALGATGYAVHHYTSHTTTPEEQERIAQSQRYTPERYPTIMSRVVYLREKYGIEARVLEHDDVRFKEKVHGPSKPDECGCITEHRTEFNLVQKAEKGDPKNFLPFLDALCRATDQYPIEIFKKMSGLEVQMASKITLDGVLDGTVGGYSDGPSHIVMVYTPSSDHNQNVFHHEFFHALDFRHNNLQKDDDRWVAQSGSKGAYLGHKNLTLDDLPWTPPTGFARKYGKASIPEDQATIGEHSFQPHALKYMLRRAKDDKWLLVKIQLLTASVIDLHAERFSRTMTEEEYKTYSGFSGYRYYRAWSQAMDHTFWNGILDRAVSAEDSRKNLSRNRHDSDADLIYHLLGDNHRASGRHRDAADYFHAAHELEFAKKEYSDVAAHLGNHEESYDVAFSYEQIGEKAKAKQLYETSALQAVARGNWMQAALAYAGAKNISESQINALKFFQQIKTAHEFELHAEMMAVVQACYDWKNLPTIAIDLLHTMAKKRGGVEAITIYEKLGEVPSRAAPSVDRWYLKMARRLEAEGHDLDKVASLYEKGGNFDEARRCLGLQAIRKAESLPDLARTFRRLAELESSKK